MSDDDRLDPGAYIAALDQLGAAAASMAQVYGTYYRALRASGCSKRLARQLVRDHHYEMFCNFRPEEDDPDA